MDINEPSLMDVAHDTINSTQGPALIEGSKLLTLLVAKEKGRAFFVVIVGGSHDIYAGRQNQTKVEGPFDSLRGIDLGLFVRSITKGGTTMDETSRPRFFCIVRGPAAAEQRGIAAPSPGAIPGPSCRRAGRA